VSKAVFIVLLSLESAPVMTTQKTHKLFVVLRGQPEGCHSQLPLVSHKGIYIFEEVFDGTEL